MRIRVGYELIYDCPQPTPMLLMLNVHHSRVGDIVVPDQLTTDPPLAVTRIVTGSETGAAGSWRRQAPCAIASTAVVNDSGTPDPVVASASQQAVQDLPEDDAGIPTRQPLLRDRSSFRGRLAAVRPEPAGLGRVQAICDFVHNHIAFDYAHARATKNGTGRRSMSVVAYAAILLISRWLCAVA